MAPQHRASSSARHANASGDRIVRCRARRAPCAPRRRRRPSTGRRSARWDASVFSDQAYDPRWWRQLEDPVLEELENAALDANRDVRSALARLDQARAVFDEDRRRRYPTVTAGAFVDVREQAQPGFSDEPLRINTYRAGFDASWELDLFGRVRSAIAAASANAESFEAALASVRVSVAAEVARNYFELRGIQQQLSVLDRSLANQRETLRLTEVRRDAGIGEEQDVASAVGAGRRRSRRRVPPLRTALAGARASAGGADRPSAGAAERRPRAARLSGAGEVDRARAARPAAQSASRRARGRAPAGRDRGAGRRRRGRSLSAHHAHRACSACWPDAATSSARAIRARGR